MTITLSGSNDYMIETELKKILDDFRNKYGEISIEQIDGSEIDLQSIINSINGLSFLSPNKLIILRRGSSNKQFIDLTEQIINNIPSINQLVIIEPHIDKRLSYYKLLMKLTEFKSYDELEFNDLTRWIKEKVKQNGGSINDDIARYLIEIAGSDQLKLLNEVTKLMNYQTNITKSTVDNLVEPIPQTTIFQLLNAAFSGNGKELLRIYDDQKRQKVEPQQIIAMLTWQIHIIAMIKAAGDTTPSEIARKTKVNSFVINKSINIANKMTRQQIRDLTRNLLNLDIKLKNQSIDIDEALLQLLLTINV